MAGPRRRHGDRRASTICTSGPAVAPCTTCTAAWLGLVRHLRFPLPRAIARYDRAELERPPLHGEMRRADPSPGSCGSARQLPDRALADLRRGGGNPPTWWWWSARPGIVYPPRHCLVAVANGATVIEVSPDPPRCPARSAVSLRKRDDDPADLLQRLRTGAPRRLGRLRRPTHRDLRRDRHRHPGRKVRGSAPRPRKPAPVIAARCRGGCGSSRDPRPHGRVGQSLQRAAPSRARDVLRSTATHRPAQWWVAAERLRDPARTQHQRAHHRVEPIAARQRFDGGLDDPHRHRRTGGRFARSDQPGLGFQATTSSTVSG